MPRAEVGSTKYLSNKLKSKGLQRLRWYCQVCERQMRDENGFKMHTQSEGHVRQMLVVGENARSYIANYSHQFKRDFLQLLRTSHGEKMVHINHFYQEYISNKEHIHMNATRWNSLTEFAKFLGREGICRVEENEKGVHLAWIDNSPESMRRQEALRKRERQDKDDEHWEQRQIRAQIKKAQEDAEERGIDLEDDDDDDQDRQLKREAGEKIKLSFAASSAKPAPKADDGDGGGVAKDVNTASPGREDTAATASEGAPAAVPAPVEAPSSTAAPHDAPAGKVSLKIGLQNKPKNVFAAAKKNALGGKKMAVMEPPKKMSEAERIMKEEIERKRSREAHGFSSHKRPRF